MKKPKKAKKPMKTILRIGLPLFLAAIILWGCSMVQVTTSSAQRMEGQLPQGMEYIAERFRSFIANYDYNYGSFDRITELRDLSGWTDDFLSCFMYNRDYLFNPFPTCIEPFLLDLTGFETLPDDLRYGCHFGIALVNEDGTPLLTTRNLMTLEVPEVHYSQLEQALIRELEAEDPVTLRGGEPYFNIGVCLAAHADSGWNDFNDCIVWRSVDPTDPYRTTYYTAPIFLFDDYVLSCAVGGICQPMRYCMLRLIPIYFITLVAAILLVYIYLLFIKRKLLNPLREQAVAMEQHLPPLSQEELDRLQRNNHWTEPATARSHVIRLQKIKAEMTRLETALDYAKDAEENRKQLISNITHELKTPLAVIHSYAEGLQSGIAAEKKEHYVEVILDEADRMDAMVLQMLELSRLEAGRVKITLNSFSFSELVQYVAEKFQPLLDAKNLSIQLDLVEPLTIHASESRLEQVLTNYLSNAVRYTPCGGQIVIRAACNQKEMFFDITNTAPHLSEEGLEKVYDSFYREETSRSTKSTGLGLAIVKGIISLHSGECYVSNTELDGESAVHFGFRIPK